MYKTGLLYTVCTAVSAFLLRTVLNITAAARVALSALNQPLKHTTYYTVRCACTAGLKRTLRDRRVQQEASLTSLHRVVEGRSAQLSRQEARIRQRDDIMARTTVIF
jgi:hypothetical protein